MGWTEGGEEEREGEGEKGREGGRKEEREREREGIVRGIAWIHNIHWGNKIWTFFLSSEGLFC